MSKPGGVSVFRLNPNWMANDPYLLKRITRLACRFRLICRLTQSAFFYPDFFALDHRPGATSQPLRECREYKGKKIGAKISISI